jgi:hypothetical protein
MSNVEYERDDYKRKMHVAFEQVKIYEDTIKRKDCEIKILTERLKSAQTDSTTIRKIMTDNLTESNDMRQRLLSDISSYKSEIKRLKDGDND